MNFQKILVTTDFSENGDRACSELSARLGADFSGELILITVIPDWPVPFTLHEFIPDPATMEHYRKEMLAAADSKVKGLAKKLFGNVKNVTALAVLSPKSIADEIVQQATDRKVDLLAMGSSGHGALGRIILGSTIQQVLRSCTCPVLVIPAKK